MLSLYSGTDREKVRTEANAAVRKLKREVVRITDANASADVQAALQGGGMFGGGKRAVVFDGTFANEEMRVKILSSLMRMRDAEDAYYILEEKLDAQTRKQIEKFAEDSMRFDAAKKAESKTIFALSNALRRADKKALWVGYQKELLSNAPEAIHGVLFWAAKQMFLGASSAKERERAKKIVATLAELPHESRRRGVELEYALEQFVLSVA